MRRPYASYLCLISIFAVASATAQDIRVPVGVRAAEIVERQSAEGLKIEISNGVALRDYGQPELPLRRLTLLVPADRRVAQVRLEGGIWQSLGSLGTLVRHAGDAVPGQPPLHESWFSEKERASSASYPPVVARSLGDQFLHGYRLASIEYFPVRVSPDGELFALSGGELVAELEPAELPRELAVRERVLPQWRARLLDTLRATVSNPGAVDGYELPVAVVESSAIGAAGKTPSLATSPVRFLILTNAAMAPEFQRLADHRTKLGLPALVVTIDEVLANYRHGLDLQETLRLYIRDAYTKWGVDYVLLGGDSDVIPPRYATSTFYPSGASTDIPADLYYSCLDGNWNADGDATFGDVFVSGLDPGDSVDLVPELAVGRATTSTVGEAQLFVDKILEYEIPTNVGHQTRALFASEVLFPDDFSQGQPIQLDGATFSEDIINNSLVCEPDWDHDRYYENYSAYFGSFPEIKNDVLTAMNSGNYGVFDHIGHGFYFNMSVGSGNLVVADTGSLSNGPNYYLLYALNCSSAAFDFSCISERILGAPGGGSVASLGSTRSAFPNAANNYQQEFFSAAICSGDRRLGDAVNASRLPYSGNTFFNTSDRWTHFCYVLLGDPSMPMWTQQPRSVSISAPASAALGPNNLSITVNDVGLVAPFPGVTVTLSKDGEDYASGVTDGAGQVLLSFDAETTGDIELWVSGSNAYPQSTTIPVLTGGDAFLSAQSLAFTEDGSGTSIGNGNGSLEAGERIELLPLMRNTGTAAFSGGTLALSSSDPYVTVVQGSVALGAIGAGGSALPAAALSFDIDAAVPDGHELSFTLNADDGGGGSWDDVETVLLAGSEIEVFDVSFDDTAFGNSNGILENGETVEVIVTLKNYGAGAVQSVSALLTSSDPDISIGDGSANFGAMPGVLDVVDNDMDRFVVTETLVGPNNDYSLTLTDDAGRVLVVGFDLSKPAQVAGLTPAAGANGELAISWNKPATSDLLGYKVYRRPVGGGSYALASPDIVLSGSTFRESGLPPLSSFEYAVAAVDSGKLSGPLSNPVVASTAPSEIGCFPLPMGQETSSDLAITQLDPDGVPDMIIGSEHVYVIDGNCEEVLDGDADAQSFGPITGVAGKYGPASIAVGNLDADPWPEIVASSWGTVEIYVFEQNGDIVPGWPVTPPAKNWGTPAIGDLDGDGDNEIVFIDTAGYVNAFHHDGTEVADGDANGATLGPIAPKRVGESFGRTSPALYDVDNDGVKEILFGSKFSSDVTADVFYALEPDGSGSNAAGWPKVLGPRSEFLASPTVADIDDDGTVEIIAQCENDSLYVWHPDGSKQSNFPKKFTSQAVNRDSLAPSPAVGDFTGDGKLEMVIVETVGATSSRVSLVDWQGSVQPGWPISIPNLSESSPIVGDINGDGLLDIVWGMGGGSDNAPNYLYAWNRDGSAVTGFPIFLSGFVRSTPTLADFNMDGNIDLALASWDRLIHVWDLAAPYDPLKVPFPTFRSNNRRDGVYVDPVQTVDTPAARLDASRLLPNAPNPFNPSTTLLFEVVDGGASLVELRIFDSAGRMVRAFDLGALDAGRHRTRWDGRDQMGASVASGIYFVELRIDGHAAAARKIALVK